MHNLIESVFLPHFDDPLLAQQSDSALVRLITGRYAFTTDAYVVNPIIFSGGNIGKLAVCGTVNDLVAAGAKPLYLSASFILEEGLEIPVLSNIVRSMADAAREAGVRIVCGDTKVVERGKCDKLFINTSGIGEVDERNADIASGKRVSPGDRVIISGTLGDHGMAVLATRNNLGFMSEIKSDCAPLYSMMEPVFASEIPLHFMRDPTRGGLAASLCEVVKERAFGIVLEENTIPVKETVRGMCELYGFDPLHIANEGKMVIIVPGNRCDEVVKILSKTDYGREAAIIGTVSADNSGLVTMNTVIGGTRIVSMPAGEQLPRIC